MHYKYSLLSILMMIFLGCTTTPNSISNVNNNKPQKETIKITVQNIERTIIVFYPNKSEIGPSPLLIAYHGSGGTSLAFQNLTQYEKLWPEAIIVYPQGLSGGEGDRLNPAGEKTGWQTRPRQNADRDLLLFDRILDLLSEKGVVDLSRVYVTGQSNGGGIFSYCGSQEA